MRFGKTWASVGIMLGGAVALAGATRTDPDERAIRQHIERNYFEGVRRSDTAAAHRAFHPVVTMYFVRDGAFAQRTIPDWLGGIAERAPDPPVPDSVPPPHPRRGRDRECRHGQAGAGVSGRTW